MRLPRRTPRDYLSAIDLASCGIAEDALRELAASTYHVALGGGPLIPADEVEDRLGILVAERDGRVRDLLSRLDAAAQAPDARRAA